MRRLQLGPSRQRTERSLGNRGRSSVSSHEEFKGTFELVKKLIYARKLSRTRRPIARGFVFASCARPSDPSIFVRVGVKNKAISLSPAPLVSPAPYVPYALKS